MGKKEFYPKVAEAFKSQGYQYFDGDKDIIGKGRRHASKPDYIAIKGNTIIIGEIKSPDEGPTSPSWRQVQNSDSEKFKKVRQEVAKREKAGKVSKEVGGHEIIIRGQIPDYVSKLNKTYDLPEEVPSKGNIKYGYSIPVTESGNVEAVLKNLKIRFEKISHNESTNYIF